MAGTLICGVVDSPAGRAAADLAAALSSRLDLRVVLVHVFPGSGVDQLTYEGRLEALARTLPDAEVRLVPGSRVDGLARVAAEEGADAIVIGSRPRGTRGRNLACSLAHELEATTAVPVIIAPPVTRRRSRLRLASAN